MPIKKPGYAGLFYWHKFSATELACYLNVLIVRALQLIELQPALNDFYKNSGIKYFLLIIESKKKFD